MTSHRETDGCTLLELMAMLAILVIVMAVVVGPRACAKRAAPKAEGVLLRAAAGAIRGQAAGITSGE